MRRKVGGMRKAYHWFIRNWRWAVMGASTLAALGLTVWWFAIAKDDEIMALHAQLRLKSAVTRVKGLEAERRSRRYELVENTAEAHRLRTELHEARKVAVDLCESVDDMTELEVARAYRKMGY